MTANKNVVEVRNLKINRLTVLENHFAVLAVCSIYYNIIILLQYM